MQRTILFTKINILTYPGAPVHRNFSMVYRPPWPLFPSSTQALWKCELSKERPKWFLGCKLLGKKDTLRFVPVTKAPGPKDSSPSFSAYVGPLWAAISGAPFKMSWKALFSYSTRTCYFEDRWQSPTPFTKILNRWPYHVIPEQAWAQTNDDGIVRLVNGNSFKLLACRLFKE